MKKNLLALLPVLCLLFAAACLAEEEVQVDVTLEDCSEAGGMLYAACADLLSAEELAEYVCAGCDHVVIAAWMTAEEYLAFTKAQSDAIKASLEQDPLTQIELNQKSQELRELWDAALNTLLAEAKKVLTEAELEELAAEQRAWDADRTTAVEAAGKEYEGGSLCPFVVNSEAAWLTEERVYELYELQK